MTATLAQLLVDTNIRTALIVDDSFDPVPLANDLLIDGDEWKVLFEDITEVHTIAITALFPLYDEISADLLQQNDAFVEVLWRNRDSLSLPALSELFKRYERDRAADIARLDSLINNLTALGIGCNRAGRQFTEEVSSVDLVMIDLFMGSTQDDNAMDLSIEGLKKALASRRSNPPIVLLMSRSPRLEVKRSSFRDSVGIFESSYRVISKDDAVDTAKLNRLLFRLAKHHGDSWKLATFLTAWEDGLRDAVARTTSLIRSLDLADYAQIQHLLLADEGEPTGSYLVDVLDYVMLHEIEGSPNIIAAARGLNDLDSDKYPPPYVSGSKDLQLLVYKSSFQHKERLKLSVAVNSFMSFGDILRRKVPDPGTPSDTETISNQLRSITIDQVLLVMTPACDLQRADTERLLMLVGELEPLEATGWSYGDLPIRTPVIIMAGGERYTVKWSIKNIITLTRNEIQEAFTPQHGFEVCARLRYLHALEIQQKMLACLGRIGLTAPVPATFELEVQLKYVRPDKSLANIDVPALTLHGGVCYVGTSDRSPMSRLVICEDACNDIADKLREISPVDVHQAARPALTKLLENDAFARSLESGLPLPKSIDSGLRDVKSDDGSTVALMCRESLLPAELDGGLVRKAGLVISIKYVNLDRDPL